MQAGYTKLFSTIVTSTIWQEDAETKVVWITLLATKEKDGVARVTIPGLAHLAKVPLEKCEEVLDKFQKPDPYSRSQEFEGRRIQKVEDGFYILNHEEYKKLMSLEERREYLRLKQREYREKQKKQSESK